MNFKYRLSVAIMVFVLFSSFIVNLSTLVDNLLFDYFKYGEYIYFVSLLVFLVFLSIFKNIKNHFEGKTESIKEIWSRMLLNIYLVVYVIIFCLTVLF
jgi:hypothetical protein